MESPVLLLTGPPGAGKTSAAQRLALRFDRAVHLEADLFFAFICGGYVEPWKPESREQNDTVMGIVANAAAGYADAGYFVIVDGIILPDYFLEPVRETLREAGHEVEYVVLRAPLEVCSARAQARDEVPLADQTVVEQLWKDFSELGPLEDRAIDVESRDPDEVASLLWARLQAASTSD
jgi:predicted kinase